MSERKQVAKKRKMQSVMLPTASTKAECEIVGTPTNTGIQEFHSYQERKKYLENGVALAEGVIDRRAVAQFSNTIVLTTGYISKALRPLCGPFTPSTIEKACMSLTGPLRYIREPLMREWLLTGTCLSESAGVSLVSRQEKIPLAKKQRELLGQFYALPSLRVIFNKDERKAIEKQFNRTREVPKLGLETKCPAVLAEFQKAVQNNKLLQQAVFSECVYAQTLANVFGLSEFYNYSVNPESLSDSVKKLIASYHLTPRYVYRSPDNRRALVQAGGSAGTDSALITIEDNDIFTIEFKEPIAKTSEPDIPKAYNESGALTPPASFLEKYPQFELMLNEQVSMGVNILEIKGTNVKTFSEQSVVYAISQNYSAKRYADVICVEDTNGLLTMMPANQVQIFSENVGELRTVGRNTLKVWTPQHMHDELSSIGATISDGLVRVPLAKIDVANERGSGGTRQSRYKFGKVYMVKIANATVTGEVLSFRLDKARQVKPTISAHMDFTGLEYSKVRDYYRPEL